MVEGFYHFDTFGFTELPLVLKIEVFDSKYVFPLTPHDAILFNPPTHLISRPQTMRADFSFHNLATYRTPLFFARF